MNIILLSGGSGKRLWPLSNSVRSKQFIKIFKGKRGEYESMIQRMYHSICEIDKGAKITIATSKSQVSELINQLGEGLNISVEPSRRDTFPAITLAAVYLRDVMHVSENESVIVCPVDPYVEDDYFRALMKLDELAQDGLFDLSLMGMNPTYPSEKYGYIIPNDKKNVSRVLSFKEKPDAITAEKYISQGALWNSGIFAFKLGYIIKKAKELFPFSDYKDLFQRYSEIQKISFDYAIVEHTQKIQVLRFNGKWKDLGTWNTFTESMDKSTIGNVVLNDKCENLHVVNSLNLPILCLGVKNLIVAASNEGVLITDPIQSASIKPFVDEFETSVKFAEKSWGKYEVIDTSQTSLTIKAEINSGHRMSYHSHERRDETWALLSGKGTVIVDGVVKKVNPGDVVTMKAGCKHTIIADTDIQLIEIQLGKDIDVRDKKKFELQI